MEHTQSVTERAGTEGRGKSSGFWYGEITESFYVCYFCLFDLFLDTVPKLNHPSVTLTCHQL